MKRRAFCAVLGVGSIAGCLRLEEEEGGDAGDEPSGQDDADGQRQQPGAEEPQAGDGKEDPDIELSEAWSHEGFSHPFVYDGQFVGRHDGDINILSRSGEVVWSSDTGGVDRYTVWPTAGSGFATNDDSVFVHYISFSSEVDKDARVYAFDADTGEQQWLYQTDRRGLQAMTADDDTVYFGGYTGDNADDRTYQVTAVDGTTGQRQWSRQVRDDSLADMVVYDSTLYVGQSELYTMNPDDGEIQTEYDINVRVRGFLPRLGEERLYLTDRDTLTRFDLEADQLRSTVAFDERLDRPTIGEGVIYSGRRDGVVTAYNIENGTELWQNRVDGRVVHSALDSGILWVLDTTGLVTALDTDTGGVLYQRTVEDSENRVAALDGRVFISEHYWEAYDIERA